MTHDATAAHVPGFATLAVHAGAPSGPAAAPFGIPASAGLPPHLVDPACAALEERVAALEGGTAALAVASGTAARQVAFHTLMGPGDEFIASTALDGASVAQFERAFERFGWTVRWADPDDPAAFEAAVNERTRAVFVEALSDGSVADVGAIAAVARRARVPLIVDNTLATPYLFRPLEHGADIVVHSATGSLSGHGGSRAGVIVDGGAFDWLAGDRFPSLSRPWPEYGGTVLGETFGNFAFAVACRVLASRDLGPALSRFEAEIVLAGIETLPLRMRRQCDTALEVATVLTRHPGVSRVSYPGLPDSPYHALAERHFSKGSGATFTVRLEGGREAGTRLVARLKLFSRGGDLGGTRSLAFHPAASMQGRPDAGGRGAAGGEGGAVRLSIGIEDAADLIADLDQALGS